MKLLENKTVVVTGAMGALGLESWESSDEEWELMFKLNVATMRNAIKATVPQMLEKQGGSIVNVGAYGAREGQGLMGAYCDRRAWLCA